MSSAAFESFWQAYPRKEARAACVKKWEQKHLDDHALLIVEHVKRRAKEDKKWKDGFVPMPLTFLNQERWTDEYEKITYRQPESKAPKVEEVWPQPCKWQAAANRILMAVLQSYPETPVDRVPTLVSMKQQMGRRLAALFGEGECPSQDWQKISRDGFEWLEKAACGISRKPGAETEGAGERERAAA